MLCYQGKEGVFKMRFKADINLKKWGSEEIVVNESFRETCFKILKMDILKVLKNYLEKFMIIVIFIY